MTTAVLEGSHASSVRQTYVRVAVASPLDRLFDYVLPESLGPVQPGVRVQVSFGRRKQCVGVVVATSDRTDMPADKLKSVMTVLDDTPLFSEADLALLAWISRYYQHALGEVMLAALPPALRAGKPAIGEADQASTAVFSNDKALSDAQRQAYDAIVQSEGFQAFLLHGVTGSGKTEVYFQVIAHVLDQGKSCLVVVPEIALTPQTVSRFAERFEANMVVLHSALSAGARTQAWLQAQQGVASIVIGTRSAVLTPMPHLGLIVIDEEHDASLKQQSGLRYSARDVAVFRAKQLGIPIILGSATPSLESLHQVAQGRYRSLNLPERVAGAAMPVMSVVDCRQQPVDHGITASVIAAMRQTLEAGHQVLVFLNRRGYAPVLQCQSCGWVSTCGQCDQAMVMHQQPAHLACHHCGCQSRLMGACPDCGRDTLLPMGAGTERLAEHLAAHFPDVPVLRVDRDSTRRRGAMDALLKQMHREGPTILLGTQMLAKGHHFPRVTLAVILNVDSGLFSVDFRATERMGQLIVQVAGRAGRAAHPGKVLLQSYHPDHPLLRQLLQAGYASFAASLLAERQAAGLPPCMHLALCHAEDAHEDKAMRFLQRVRAALDVAHVQCLGPVPSPISKRAKRYRYQLMLLAPQRGVLHGCLQQLRAVIQAMPSRVQVRWQLDVDPLDVM